MSDTSFIQAISNEDRRRALLFAMGRMAAGDRRALEDVYRLTSGRLFALCHRILPDRDQAEAVLIDVYVTVWKRASSFDGAQDSINAWLSAIARSAATDRLRRDASAGAKAPAVVPPAHDGALESQAAFEGQGRLAFCVETLTTDDAHLIRTAFLEGADYAVLASRLGIRLEEIKHRTHRAILALEECLTGDPLTPEHELRAAEFALGVLDVRSRSEAMMLFRNDDAFAERVTRWRSQYASMIRGEDSGSLGGLWPEIVKRLARRPLLRGGTLWPWQAATGAMGAMTVILLALVLRAPQSSEPLIKPSIAKSVPIRPLVGTLTGHNQGGIVTLRLDAATGRMLIVPAALKLDDQAAELWVLPDSGPARSMGIINVKGPSEIKTPTALRGPLLSGATIALSKEPEGGSASGEPTGPLFLKGKIAPL